MLLTDNKNEFHTLKRYGQNFLVDKNILNLITSRADLKNSDTVLEIGAGQGVLTRALLESGIKFLHTIEIDTRLMDTLFDLKARYKNLEIHFADAVNFDYDALKNSDKNFPNKIIANIPYNITTPLIWQLLKYAEQGFKYQLYMLQKEAALRLTAPTKTKSRYPLGITIEAMGSAKIIHEVSPKCFRPVPKVSSAIVEIIINKNFDLVKNPLWSKLLHQAFKQRRKNIFNNLKNFINADENLLKNYLSQAGIKSEMRAEEIECENWLALLKILSLTSKKTPTSSSER